MSPTVAPTFLVSLTAFWSSRESQWDKASFIFSVGWAFNGNLLLLIIVSVMIIVIRQLMASQDKLGWVDGWLDGWELRQWLLRGLASWL